MQQPIADNHQLLRPTILPPCVSIQDTGSGNGGYGCSFGPTPLGDRPIVGQPRIVRPPHLIGQHARVIRHVVQPPIKLGLLVYYFLAACHQPPPHPYF